MRNSPIAIALLVLSQSPGNAQELINLTFSPSNSGDIAAHPNVSNIQAWTNGSETVNLFSTMPTSNFGSGYAGLTVGHGLFGYRWGFEGGFDIIGASIWDVQSVSFDYEVRGHDGEASLVLGLGSWSGLAPLPTTSVEDFGPVFSAPTSGPGEIANGTVTFDFVAGELSVSRAGYATHTASFSGSQQLAAGTHLIDILVSNTVTPPGGAFDANVDSTGNIANNAFYRVDNFIVTAVAVPEPSAAVLCGFGVLALFRRRR
jgi:hypothetical protein